MGRQLFNTTIPMDVQEQNLTGAQLTAQGFAVNKFDPASLTPMIVQDNATGAGTEESFEAQGGALIPAVETLTVNAARDEITVLFTGQTLTNDFEVGANQAIFRVTGSAIAIGLDVAVGNNYIADTTAVANNSLTISNIRILNANGTIGAAIATPYGVSPTDLNIRLSGIGTWNFFDVRFTPAAAGGFESIAGITVDEASRTITVANGTTPLPEGEWHLLNWNVYIGTTATAGNLHISQGNNTEADSDNRNVSFYNCNIHYVNVADLGNVTAFSIGFGQGGGAGETTSRTFPQGAGGTRTAANTRSINSYGCTHTWYSTDEIRANRWADFIQSEIIYWDFTVGGTVTFNFSFASADGARWINSSVFKYGGNAALVNPYGQVAIEGTSFANILLRHGNAGPNQPQNFVFDRPLFVDPNQATYFDLNAGAFGNNGIIQLVGGPSIGQNTTEALGTTTGNTLRGGVIQTDGFARARGGVIQYQATGNRYFSDAQLTQGAAGVQVRVSGTINQGTITNTGATPGDRLNSDNANFSTGNVTNIGISNEDGRLASSQYILGTADPVNGFVDFFQWDTSDTQGSVNWGTSVDNAQSAAGLMIVPVARAFTGSDTAADANRVFLLVTATESSRAFRWDIHQNDTNLALPAVRQNIEIEAGPVVVSDLQGSIVKSENVGANNEPVITFASNSPASINDIRDGYRAAWYNYDFNLPVPASGVATRDTAISVVYGATNTSFTADTASVVTANMAGTTGDLFTADSNLTSINMNGGTINGHTLTTSGNMTNIGGVLNSSVLSPTGTVNTFSNNFDNESSTINGTWTGGTNGDYTNCILPGTYTHTDAPEFLGNNFTGSITVGASFTVGSGTFDGSITSTAGDITINGATVGTNAAIAAVGTSTAIVINIGPGVDASNLSLPAGNGRTINIGAGATAPSNLNGWVIPAAPAVQRNINVTIPANSNGFLTIRDIGSDSNQNFTITNGVLSGTLPTISSESTETFRISYKLDSTVGGVVYRTRVVTVNPAPSADIAIDPLIVNGFFTDNAEALTTGDDGSTNVTATGAVNGSNAARYDITWANTSSSVRPTGNETQGGVMIAANAQSYFNWIVANELTADPIDYRPATTVWNNMADGVSGLATADGVFNISINNSTGNFISNASGGLKSDDTTVTGVMQVQSVDDGMASLTTVNEAISDVMVDITNQQSDALQGATVPGKGILGTPARVSR